VTVSHIVQGTYTQAAENHGRPVFYKDSKVNGMDVLCYYWDERDGPALHGWWFAPKIAGDAVWAYNPDRGMMPPGQGWKVPYNGPVDESFKITSGSKPMKRPANSEPFGQPQKKQANFAQGQASFGAMPQAPAAPTPQDDAVTQLVLAHLDDLVPKAEVRLDELRAAVGALEGEHGLNDEDLLKKCTETEITADVSKAANKACTDLLVGHTAAVNEVQKAKINFLMNKVSGCVREVAELMGKVKPKLDRLKENAEKEARKVAAAKEDERIASLWAKHDQDKDGLLSGPELLEYVREEYKFELPDDKVQNILSELASSKAGISKEAIPRLRMMVGIAREEAKSKQRRLEKEQA